MKNRGSAADGRSSPDRVSILLDLSFGVFCLVGLAMALVRPLVLPWVALTGLAASAWPLARAWKGTRGTALRPAVVWSVVAIGLAAASQMVAIGEPMELGRPGAGHWAYIASLATLAAGVTVFGARTPGGGAWAILTGLLVLVFLIPWLEGSGLRGGGGLDRLRLEAPWSIFYAILAIAVVTNYLPTRFRGSSLLLGLSLGAEFAGLALPVRTPWGRAWLWSLGPLLLGFATLRAGLDGTFGASRSSDIPAAPGLPSLWIWFRDAWGVVWALRVRERFNRAAEASKWPVRLGWHGVEPVGPGPSHEIPEAAEATFSGLIRRFASTERVAEVALGSGANPCPPAPVPGQ